mgnify:CR=1 FL=1
MATYITVSRKWNNPTIKTEIVRGQEGGIALSMEIADFEEALAAEIDSVAWTFKKETFRKQLHAAIDRIVQGIKEESAKVV